MRDFVNKAKVFFGFDPEPRLTGTDNVKEKRKLPGPAQSRGNLIKLNTIRQQNQTEVRVIEPRIYEDCLSISTYLRDNKPVIVNLKYIDNPSGKRLVDFVCGTAYAINGHMLKIGENIFLFTPENIAITEGDDDASSSKEDIQEETKLLKTNVG